MTPDTGSRSKSMSAIIRRLNSVTGFAPSAFRSSIQFLQQDKESSDSSHLTTPPIGQNGLLLRLASTSSTHVYLKLMIDGAVAKPFSARTLSQRVAGLTNC